MNKKMVLYNILFTLVLLIYILYFGDKIWLQATGQIKAVNNSLDIYHVRTIFMNLVLFVLIGLLPNIVYIIRKKKKANKS